LYRFGMELMLMLRLMGIKKIMMTTTMFSTAD
jgi:hypothetical protein